jgi:hypothetical protein
MLWALMKKKKNLQFTAIQTQKATLKWPQSSFVAQTQNSVFWLGRHRPGQWAFLSVAVLSNRICSFGSLLAYTVPCREFVWYISFVKWSEERVCALELLQCCERLISGTLHAVVDECMCLFISVSCSVLFVVGTCCVNVLWNRVRVWQLPYRTAEWQKILTYWGNFSPWQPVIGSITVLHCWYNHHASLIVLSFCDLSAGLRCFSQTWPPCITPLLLWYRHDLPAWCWCCHSTDMTLLNL